MAESADVLLPAPAARPRRHRGLRPARHRRLRPRRLPLRRRARRLRRPGPRRPTTPPRAGARRRRRTRSSPAASTNSDALVGHVSTVEAARDMDVLRAALGESQLSYLGFSYGTTLGSTYAELFPDKVGRFVLDGATDPTLDFRQNALSQARGLRDRARAYVQNCVDGGSCFLGDSLRRGADARSATCSTRSTTTPLPTNHGPRPRDRQRLLRRGHPALQPRQLDLPRPGAAAGARRRRAHAAAALGLLRLAQRRPAATTTTASRRILAINCLDDPDTPRARRRPGRVPGVRGGLADVRQGVRLGPGRLPRRRRCEAEEPTPDDHAPRVRPRSSWWAPRATRRRRTRRPWRWPSSSTAASWSPATATATRLQQGQRLHRRGGRGLPARGRPCPRTGWSPRLRPSRARSRPAGRGGRGAAVSCRVPP